MKLIHVLLFCCISFNLFSQISISKEVDEFTKKEKIISDWATLNDPVWKSGPIAYLRLVQEDSVDLLVMKTTTQNRVLSIDENDVLYLKTEDGLILQFNNLEYTISEKGGGSVKFRGSESLGLTAIFYVNLKQLEQLSLNQVEKIRLTTSKGNIEFEPEKKKYKEEVQALFKEYLKFIKN